MSGKGGENIEMPRSIRPMENIYSRDPTVQGCQISWCAQNATQNLQKGYTTNPCNVFCVSALYTLKILVVIFAMFSLLKRHCFILTISANYFCPYFAIFERISSWRLLVTSFALSDVGINQLKVRPRLIVYSQDDRDVDSWDSRINFRTYGHLIKMTF